MRRSHPLIQYSQDQVHIKIDEKAEARLFHRCPNAFDSIMTDAALAAVATFNAVIRTAAKGRGRKGKCIT